jgi:hypothetical protein
MIFFCTGSAGHIDGNRCLLWIFRELRWLAGGNLRLAELRPAGIWRERRGDEQRPGGGTRRFRCGRGPSLAFDTSVAHQARMYDYLLGGYFL